MRFPKAPDTFLRPKIVRISAAEKGLARTGIPSSTSGSACEPRAREVLNVRKGRMKGITIGRQEAWFDEREPGKTNERLHVLNARHGEEMRRSRSAKLTRRGDNGHDGNKLEARSPGNGIRQATQETLLISRRWES